jgi:hypothetical protein
VCLKSSCPVLATKKTQNKTCITNPTNLLPLLFSEPSITPQTSGVAFKDKEPYLTCLNPFVESFKSKLADFYTEVNTLKRPEDIPDSTLKALEGGRTSRLDSTSSLDSRSSGTSEPESAFESFVVTDSDSLTGSPSLRSFKSLGSNLDDVEVLKSYIEKHAYTLAVSCK